MHSDNPEKPLLALTMGDVNGIGPEILVKALARPEPFDCAQLLVIGSAAVLEDARRAFAPGCPAARSIETVEQAEFKAGEVCVLEAPAAAPRPQYGVLSAEAGRSAIEWVRVAATLALAGKVQGLVTCPINKEAVQQAGYQCAGHTDFIADLCGVSDWRMCLFTENMRIIHITGHLSLKEAVDAVRRERISRSVRLGNEVLQGLGIPVPRIAVAGLNPHAGEAGAFGREELDEIGPAVAECAAEGIACTGPYPPDTVFRRMREGEFDLVIAMYHDQGHIPMKLIAMEEGVNVTLGIPIVRTSVDHGTAFDIAGQGVASEESLIAAIRFAARLAHSPVTV